MNRNQSKLSELEFSSDIYVDIFARYWKILNVPIPFHPYFHSSFLGRKRKKPHHIKKKMDEYLMKMCSQFSALLTTE